MLVDFWLDARAGCFSYGWGPSPGRFTYTPGEVAIYSIAAVDSTGASLGGNNYRLHLSANIPAKLFCNGALPKTGSELRCKHGPLLLYLGPNAPEEVARPLR